MPRINRCPEYPQEEVVVSDENRQLPGEDARKTIDELFKKLCKY